MHTGCRGIWKGGFPNQGVWKIEIESAEVNSEALWRYNYTSGGIVVQW